ncbi:MAG TPA: YibE/F family protein [Chloroflexi bacterium]|nr:YibE/F family protein [Chloroflexota bacterium]
MENLPKSGAVRRARYILEGIAVLLLLALVVAAGALHWTRPAPAYTAQPASMDETVYARVLSVRREESMLDQSGLVQVMQELTLEIRSAGAYAGQQIEVTYNGLGPSLETVRFKPGQLALVMISQRGDGAVFYAVADHVRWWPLAGLAAFFAVVTVVVGRWQGLRALLGLALGGVMIGGFILPQILALRDPVWVSVVGTALLMAVTLYLIQGWNPIAHTALLGLLVSLALTGLLAFLWTRLSYLTGFGSEETLYLQAIGVGLGMRGLLLAGMIIGAAGVLDDVVLAQAVTVYEIAGVAPELSSWKLYQRGMKVGVAHLASMVNTLVLAYAGAALPLMILFYLFPEPWYLTINRELIAEEIIRTLVGSLGLMVAVPLTSAIAAWAAPRLMAESAK